MQEDHLIRLLTKAEGSQEVRLRPQEARCPSLLVTGKNRRPGGQGESRQMGGPHGSEPGATAGPLSLTLASLALESAHRSALFAKEEMETHRPAGRKHPLPLPCAHAEAEHGTPESSFQSESKCCLEAAPQTLRRRLIPTGTLHTERHGTPCACASEATESRRLEGGLFCCFQRGRGERNIPSAPAVRFKGWA